MSESMYPLPTRELAQRRSDLAPEISAAFLALGRQVFAAGALSKKTKQIIAVAVAHVTQCPYCIRGHTKGANREGASDAEIMEAIWVAAEMRAGGSYAHSLLAIAEMDEARAASGQRKETAGKGEQNVGDPAEPARP